MAGKKDFGAVPTKPKSVQDFMSEDATKPQEGEKVATKKEAKPKPTPSAKKDPKDDQLAKWGTYTVQRGYRFPIALLEALQGYVAERQKTERKYSETQAVCEAVAKFLQDEGVAV